MKFKKLNKFILIATFITSFKIFAQYYTPATQGTDNDKKYYSKLECLASKFLRTAFPKFLESQPAGPEISLSDLQDKEKYNLYFSKTLPDWLMSDKNKKNYPILTLDFNYQKFYEISKADGKARIDLNSATNLLYSLKKFFDTHELSKLNDYNGKKAFYDKFKKTIYKLIDSVQIWKKNGYPSNGEHRLICLAEYDQEKLPVALEQEKLAEYKALEEKLLINGIELQNLEETEKFFHFIFRNLFSELQNFSDPNLPSNLPIINLDFVENNNLFALLLELISARTKGDKEINFDFARFKSNTNLLMSSSGASFQPQDQGYIDHYDKYYSDSFAELSKKLDFKLSELKSSIMPSIFKSLLPATRFAIRLRDVLFNFFVRPSAKAKQNLGNDWQILYPLYYLAKLININLPFQNVRTDLPELSKVVNTFKS
jgi:hypothetical protein